MKRLTTVIITILGVLVANFTFKGLNIKEDEKVPFEVVKAFKHWQICTKRLYSTPKEQEYRLQAFKKNLEIIKAHNSKEDQTYKMGLNDFSDLTQEEFEARYLQPPIYFNSIENQTEEIIKEEVDNEGLNQASEYVDWTENGCHTKVYVQGDFCSSGYAISATKAISYAATVATGEPIDQSSPQELIDCSKGYGNFGCGGGTLQDSFEYVYHRKINPDKVYYYRGSETGQCGIPSIKEEQVPIKKFSIKGYERVSMNSNDALMSAVKQQPVAASVDASTWAHYSGGIFEGNFCKTERITHYVTIVGYGYEMKSNQRYWLIENSWGTSWGVNGYMKIIRYTRTSKSPCGLPSNAYYPTGVEYK